jgi:SAM-dependent methyltransferase
MRLTTERPVDVPPSDGAYFDRLIEETGDFNPFTDRGWRTLQRCFARASGGASALRVLDVGCGTGQSHCVYASQASRYVGVDLSLAALRIARARHAHVDWLRCDGLRLPFSNGTFDVVAFSSVLHHVPDVPAALRSAIDVLRPGGLIFAFDPNLLHPGMFLFRRPMSPLYTAEGVSPGEQPLPPRLFRRAFDEAGLREVGQRCQSDIPYRAVAPRLLNRALTLYNAADWVWEKIGAGRWFGTFVLTWGRTPE